MKAIRIVIIIIIIRIINIISTFTNKITGKMLN
jgi:hypothetical protein